MRISDVVNQVRLVLPKYTDVLSTLIDVESAIVTGEIPENRCRIITLSAHGLSVGDPVVLQNFGRENILPGYAVTGEAYTFGVTLDHDLTYSPGATITLYGFADSTWNTTLSLLSVPRRDRFVVQAPSGASPPIFAGGEHILENLAYGINGYYAVGNVVDTTTFEITGNFKVGIYKGGKLSANARVAGAVSPERAIKQYTKQGLTDIWAYVTPEDVIVSKDMHAESDAIATNTAGDDYWLRMLDGFTLFFIANTTQDIAGVDSVNICRHDLLYPVLKTLCGVRFNEGLTYGGDFKTVLARHGIHLYSKAYLVYYYTFEIPTDITNDDTSYDGETKALKKITYIHTIDGVDTVDARVDNISLY